MNAATPVIPYISSCLGQGKVYFLTLENPFNFNERQLFLF